MKFVGKEMELVTIIPSKGTHIQKEKCFMGSVICGF